MTRAISEQQVHAERPRRRLDSHTLERRYAEDADTVPRMEVTRISTEPPRPFESETDVTGLAYWFDLHMNLASAILYFERIMPEPPPPGVGSTLKNLGEVRDALYALYCDIADPRALDLGELVRDSVRGIYVWAEGLTRKISASLLSEEEGRIAVHVADVTLVTSCLDHIRRGLFVMGASADDPCSPLRFAPGHLDVLSFALKGLCHTLLA